MASAACSAAETETSLDQVVSGLHILDIVGIFTLNNVEDVCKHLGLEAKDITNLKSDPGISTGQLAESMLNLWYSRNGEEATIRTFLEAVKKVKNAKASYDQIKRRWKIDQACANDKQLPPFENEIAEKLQNVHIAVNIKTKEIQIKPCLLQSIDNDSEEVQRSSGKDHIGYKKLTYKVIERFTENKKLFDLVKWIFTPGPNRRGIPHVESKDMEPYKFIGCLEESGYLSEHNLDFLYEIMFDENQNDLARDIKRYQESHAGDSLTEKRPRRTSARGIWNVEIVLPGDISKRSGHDVIKYKGILHERTNVPKSAISYTGNGSGCVVLSYQLPLRWPAKSGENEDIDVLRKLKDDVSQRADWLKDSDVIGIHIEGQDYVDLTGISPKGLHEVDEELILSDTDTSGHVMISYHWDSKKQVLKLRDKLKEAGYSIWMDIDKEGGGLLETMRMGLEKAGIVLVCMSKKYHDSQNCMAEAILAFQKNKTIIPLNLEDDFEPSGWLGSLVHIPLDTDELLVKNFPDLIRALDERSHNAKDEDAISIADDCKSFPESFKNELIEFYKREMRLRPLLPWLQNDEERPIEDIYIDLELAANGEKLDNYEDLVTLKPLNKVDTYAKRVLVLGDAGSGKTSLMSKIAYSWSQQNHPKLNQFELVFHLRMRDLHSCNNQRHCLRRGTSDPYTDCSLLGEIFNQIPETCTDVYVLDNYIKWNPTKILILLDGWDESVLDHRDLEKTKRCAEHDIANLLISKKQPSSCVIVTSRPYKFLSRHHYSTVIMKGFSKENVNNYIRKFFKKDDDRAQALIGQLQTSGILFNITKIPVMLMMICWIWGSTMAYGIPKQMTELYQLLVQAIWGRYCCKQGFVNMLESDMSMALKTLGNVALQGILQERLVFDMREMDTSSAVLGLQLGLLNLEKHIVDFRIVRSVSFLHKSFQEYCAALFLANNPDRLVQFIKSLDSLDLVLSKQELLLFCCGLCSKMPGNDGATNIIKYAISCLVKDGCENMHDEISVGSYHATTCNILPVLEMISESGQISLDALSIPISDLIYADKLSIHSAHPQTLPVFHPFVMSRLGDSLCNIHAIRFDHHPLSALDIISDTLKCMPKVHHITLNFSDSTGVASEPSMTQLGKSIASLSKLSTLSVRHAHNGLDIGVIFHHLSQSPSKTLKYLHFEDTHVGDAIAHIGGIIPHLESITFRDVAFEYRHMASLCDRLPNAPCLFELDLLGNPIGNDALHVLFTHIHHLARLQLLVISAIVDCNCSPLVKECLMVAGKDDIPVEACAISLLYEENVIQSLLSISRNAATSLASPKQTQS